MKRLYIFTTKGCPYCEQLKDLLYKEKISFFNLDVEANEDEYLPIIEQTGLDYVPAVMLLDTEVNQRAYLVPEKDFQTLIEAVELIKSNIYANAKRF
jgi:glutaredoxin